MLQCNRKGTPSRDNLEMLSAKSNHRSCLEACRPSSAQARLALTPYSACFRVAGLLITTEASVAEVPKKQGPAMSGGGAEQHGRHGLLEAREQLSRTTARHAGLLRQTSAIQRFENMFLALVW